MTSARVHYRERQLLTVADLRDEQWHRITRWHGHLREHHGWGIVSGLQAVLNKNGSLIICPGLAIDGYGRMLRVNKRREIDLQKVQERARGCIKTIRDARIVCLCLRHVLLPGRSECDPNWTGGRRPSSDRWLESHVIVLAYSLDTCDPWNPPRLSILDDKLEPLPQGANLDEPCGPRLVPICCLPAPPSTKKSDKVWESHFVEVETSAGMTRLYPVCAPWATLTAEHVAAPSGNAKLVVGTDPTDPMRRFGVAVRDADGDLTDYRLEINSHHDVRITGPAVLDGELSVESPSSGNGDHEGSNGVSSSGSAIVFNPLSMPEGESPAPRPWQIYRVRQAPDASHPASLRFEIQNPGENGDPSRYSFVVGAGPKEKSNGDNPANIFTPILSARANGRVRIENNPHVSSDQANAPTLLTVEGVLREGAIPADLSDPRFSQKLLELSTSGQLDCTFTGPPTLTTKNSLAAISYEVNIGNVGSVDIGGIQLHQSVYTPQEDGEPPDPRTQFKIVDNIFLRAQHELTVSVERRDMMGIDTNITPRPSLILAVLVFGAGPGGSIIYAIQAQRCKWNEGD